MNDIPKLLPGSQPFYLVTKIPDYLQIPAWKTSVMEYLRRNGLLKPPASYTASDPMEKVTTVHDATPPAPLEFALLKQPQSCHSSSFPLETPSSDNVSIGHARQDIQDCSNMSRFLAAPPSALDAPLFNETYFQKENQHSSHQDIVSKQRHTFASKADQQKAPFSCAPEAQDASGGNNGGISLYEQIGDSHQSFAPHRPILASYGEELRAPGLSLPPQNVYNTNEYEQRDTEFFTNIWNAPKPSLCGYGDGQEYPWPQKGNASSAPALEGEVQQTPNSHHGHSRAHHFVGTDVNARRGAALSDLTLPFEPYSEQEGQVSYLDETEIGFAGSGYQTFHSGFGGSYRHDPTSELMPRGYTEGYELQNLRSFDYSNTHTTSTNGGLGSVPALNQLGNHATYGRTEYPFANNENYTPLISQPDTAEYGHQQLPWHGAMPMQHNAPRHYPPETFGFDDFEMLGYEAPREQTVAENIDWFGEPEPHPSTFDKASRVVLPGYDVILPPKCAKLPPEQKTWRGQKRTKACMVHSASTGVELPPPQKPTAGRPFLCARCGQNYPPHNNLSSHFLSCVRKYVNPDGLCWDSHISCCWTRHRHEIASASRGKAGQASKAPATVPVFDISTGLQAYVGKVDFAQCKSSSAT